MPYAYQFRNRQRAKRAVVTGFMLCALFLVVFMAPARMLGWAGLGWGSLSVPPEESLQELPKSAAAPARATTPRGDALSWPTSPEWTDFVQVACVECDDRGWSYGAGEAKPLALLSNFQEPVTSADDGSASLGRWGQSRPGQGNGSRRGIRRAGSGGGSGSGGSGGSGGGGSARSASGADTSSNSASTDGASGDEATSGLADDSQTDAPQTTVASGKPGKSSGNGPGGSPGQSSASDGNPNPGGKSNDSTGSPSVQSSASTGSPTGQSSNPPGNPGVTAPGPEAVVADATPAGPDNLLLAPIVPGADSPSNPLAPPSTDRANAGEVVKSILDAPVGGETIYGEGDATQVSEIADLDAPPSATDNDGDSRAADIIPEPASLALVGLALAGGLFKRHRTSAR